MEQYTITHRDHNPRQQYCSVNSSSIDFDVTQQQLCRYSSAVCADNPVYTISPCHPLVLESLLQKTLTNLLPFPLPTLHGIIILSEKSVSFTGHSITGSGGSHS